LQFGTVFLSSFAVALGVNGRFVVWIMKMAARMEGIYSERVGLNLGGLTVLIRRVTGRGARTRGIMREGVMT